MSTLLLAPSRPTEAEQRDEAADGMAKAQVRLRSRLYLPAFSIAALALILIALGWSEGWGGKNFTGSVTMLRVVLVGPLALVILGCFMVVERIWPAQRRPLFARGHRHDLILTVMNASLVAPLVTALTLAFVEVVRNESSHGSCCQGSARFLAGARSWPSSSRWTSATGRFTWRTTGSGCSGAFTSSTIPRRT